MKYKYLGSGEFDLKPVEEFTLKYATLPDLNDPYEATATVPHDEEELRTFVNQEILGKPMGEVLARVPDIIEAVKQECPTEKLFNETMAKRLPEVLSREQLEQLVANLLQKRHQTIHTAWEQNGQKKMADLFGILCLSDTCESYLMWSHYANKHQGYCIGFDDNDAWFNPLQRNANLELNKKHQYLETEAASLIGCLRKVDYDRERAKHTSPSNIANALVPYFRKSQDWHYEQEHRMLLPLNCSEPEGFQTSASLQQPFLKLIRRSLTVPHSEIFLRKFHPSLIKEIVFGIRCSLEMQTGIRSALANYNVTYSFAIPSSVDYTIKKEAAFLDQAYDPMNSEIIKKRIIAEALQTKEL